MTTVTGAVYGLAMPAPYPLGVNTMTNTTSTLFAASNNVTATAAVIAAGDNVELLRDAVLELAALEAAARDNYARAHGQVQTLAREYDAYALAHAPRDMVTVHAEDSYTAVTVWRLFASAVYGARIANGEVWGGCPVFEYTVTDLVTGEENTRAVYGRGELRESVLNMLDAVGASVAVTSDVTKQLA